ncbi:uncharacterized protein DUF4422 [Cricetibacter osteomyelitidis]|uniref:Uncharacterized protein DUF4422 n=1 Tax=Cricetibacter osteomyelitidis TaxID=1521931 RepID=A0A4R2T708_9PAST|nr:DUF4422 domain-containing protein [Cricetibacter osteomyelitidis]TCP97276.1 uncharacterized protein DUF4422 [Cricetibacter osteomyelitidis]
MNRLNQHINIFIATHKVFRAPAAFNSQIYTPIQVGIKPNMGYLSENQLDNIAHKNTWFYELTALYFLWKNVKSEYAGLVHYRRFFASKFNQSKILDRSEMELILSIYDIILPKKFTMGNITVKDQYIKHHYLKDWDLTRKIIAEYQSDYLEAFDKISRQTSLFPYNMFISKKEISDEYCEWLFGILFNLESLIDISYYDQYQQRIFVFLAERLFNVWLWKNNDRFTHYCLPLQNSGSSQNNERIITQSTVYYKKGQKNIIRV